MHIKLISLCLFPAYCLYVSVPVCVMSFSLSISQIGLE